MFIPIISLLKIMNRCCLCVVTLLLSTAAFTQDCNIVDFGAVGDGITNNTAAIQRAIDSCSANGGRVYFPKGVFTTGTLILKSNITLYLSTQAVLKGTADTTAYPRRKPSSYRSHLDTYSDKALLFAENQENIYITGGGTFDGNGDHPVFQDRIEGSTNRPFGIKMIQCRNVELSHINMRNSAFWMQVYLACDKVRLHDLNIYNHCNMNNDGIDIDGCNDVIVSNCIIDTSDDNICFKSTGLQLTQNVTVNNCILSTHCYAVKCGTESTGGFRNITVSNIVVKPSASKLNNESKDVAGYGQDEGQSAIALQITDGGVMENINISDFVIDSIESPVFIKLGNRGRKHRPDAPRASGGSMQNIRIGNITATNAGTIASSVTGYPGAYIRNVLLYNIDIQSRGGGTAKDTAMLVPENANKYPKHSMFNVNLPAYGLYVRHVQHIRLHQVQFRVTGEDVRPALVFHDVEDIELNGKQLHPARSAADAPGLTDLIKRQKGLVAFWDFANKTGKPSAGSAKEVELLPFNKGKYVPEGPLSGNAIEFDGESDYWHIDHLKSSKLDIKTNAVTVIAWVKWIGKTGFVAGKWNEYADGGKRQYGLFVSLPYYNGKHQVCGHISKNGGATPPFPYSIDYSASPQTVPVDEWACVAFTYDGQYIRSYFNGRFQERAKELISHTAGFFSDKPDGIKQVKNPYYYPDGMGNNRSDFTVGAVQLKKGMGNFFKGKIGGIAVFDKALTKEEMEKIAIMPGTR